MACARAKTAKSINHKNQQNHFKLGITETRSSNQINTYRKIDLLLKIYHLIVGSVYRRFLKRSFLFLNACLGIQQFSGTPIEAFMRSRYRQHNLYVESTCPSSKLLIYNVKDGWGPLCKFLNKKIPDKPFPRENIKAEMTHKLLANKWEHDCGLMEDLHRRFTILLGTLVFLIIAIISYVVMKDFEN
ncbi:uncharacterized protein LOC120339519 [Styela clava]